MDQIKISRKEIQPWFELEDFMNFSRESRIENDIFEKITRLWEEWSAQLNVLQLENDGKSWLAVWLPAEIEEAVDNYWNESPSKGYMLNNLAQYLCMCAVQELVPAAAAGGCAPAPAPETALRAALEKAGVKQAETGTLERRYAVVTHFPFKGGCEVCYLRPHCPKGNGAADSFASVVLPGYERGGKEKD